MKIDKETIAYLLMALGIIIVLVMTAWYLLGHSPTTEQLLMAYVLAPYVFTFGVYERLNGKIEKVNDKISETREDFQHEMGEIKQTLGRMWLRAYGSQTRV